MRALMTQRAQAALEGTELVLEWAPVFDGLPPLETPADAEIVKAVESLSGSEAEAVSFGTEAGLFQGLGISTVVCGPGSIEQAHKPDEYVTRDQLAKALTTLAGLRPRLASDVFQAHDSGHWVTHFRPAGEFA